MADRPYIDFQEVKDRCPIPEVLDKLGVTYKRKGDKLSCVCPIPTHVHGPQPNDQQFKADRGKGTWLWRCFGDCNRGGDVLELVKAVNQQDDAHVRFWFAEQFGDRLTLTKPKEKKQGDESSPAKAEIQGERPSKEQKASGLKPMRFYLDLDLNRAVEYLESRGISRETGKKYGVGLCNKGMFEGYLAIPCYRHPKGEETENPIGYVGRWPTVAGEVVLFSEERPKWKNGFDVGNCVFGLEQAMYEREGEVNPKVLIVVENPLTAMWLAEKDVPAVSTFSSNISDKQAEILSDTGYLIVLCFDGDEAGYSGMRAGAGKLITRSYVRVVKLPAGVKPDTDEGFSLLWEV